MNRLALTIALSALLATAAAAQPPTKVRVGYDGFSMTSGPLNYAEKQGLFKRFGLDVTPVFVEGGSTLTTAVVGRSIDIAQNKAYTAASFKSDTLALAARAKGEDSIAPLSGLPHVMFFGGGVPIKLGDETIGAIGASGAPGGKLDDACARAGLDNIKDRLQ